MQIDDIIIGIIKHLRDGRKSYKKIAEDLAIEMQGEPLSCPIPA